MALVPELIAYIRQQTQEGVGAQELRITLMEAGWNELDIENALHDVAAGLQPVTAGASIHEDLAQVRGMVAHLASRVKFIEARLVSAPGTPMELPTGEVPSLPRGTIGPSRFVKVVSMLAGILILGFAGWYIAMQVAQSTEAPTTLFAIAGVVGAVLLSAGYACMRTHRPWLANLMAASSIALWSVIVWHAWRTYHLLQHQTAIGLYVLMAVLLVVMGRWIDRLSR